MAARACQCVNFAPFAVQNILPVGAPLKTKLKGFNQRDDHYYYYNNYYNYWGNRHIQGYIKLLLPIRRGVKISLTVAVESCEIQVQMGCNTVSIGFVGSISFLSTFLKLAFSLIHCFSEWWVHTSR